MDTVAWPCGRGDMAERIRSYDRAPTPLGPIFPWPQSLKAAVEPMPNSGFPLALHELAANARKYGALSTAQGRLRIGRHAAQLRRNRSVVLTWIEERAVCVAVQRDRRGHGRELIERALAYSLDAETRYELDEAGPRCTMTLPLSKEAQRKRGA